MANYMICLMIKNSIKYINFHVYPQLLLLYSLTTITVAEVPLFDTVGLWFHAEVAKAAFSYLDRRPSI